MACQCCYKTFDGQRLPPKDCREPSLFAASTLLDMPPGALVRVSDGIIAEHLASKEGEGGKNCWVKILLRSGPALAGGDAACDQVGCPQRLGDVGVHREALDGLLGLPQG